MSSSNFKRRTYKDPMMQRAYNQKMDEYETTGMPHIGSISSSSFRDGFFGRPCKRSQRSAAFASHMAGRDCRRA
jgi:hypothetical protein